MLSKVLLGVLAVFAAVAVAPDIYDAINDTALNALAPAWVITLLGLVVGFGLIFIVYKAFIGNRE